MAGSSTRHTRARRQLGNNNKMFPCDWFKGEPLISAPAIFRFSCVLHEYVCVPLPTQLSCIWLIYPCSDQLNACIYRFTDNTYVFFVLQMITVLHTIQSSYSSFQMVFFLYTVLKKIHIIIYKWKFV